MSKNFQNWITPLNVSVNAWPTLDQFPHDSEMLEEAQREVFFRLGRQVGKILMTDQAFWKFLGVSPALRRVIWAVWERMECLEELYEAVTELDLIDDFDEEPHPIFGNPEEIAARRRVSEALEAVWDNDPDEEDFENESR